MTPRRAANCSLASLTRKPLETSRKHGLFSYGTADTNHYAPSSQASSCSFTIFWRMSRPGCIQSLDKSGGLPGWNFGQWCGHGLETRRLGRCWQLPKCPRRRLHMVDLGASPRQCVHVLCHRVTAPSWGAAPAFLTTPWMRMPSPQFFCLTLFQPSKSDRLCHCRFRIRISLSAHTCLPG